MKEKDKVYILGPCSLESEDVFFTILDHLDNIMHGKNWYMKASFDKANRTSLNGKRGPGLEYSMDIWKQAKYYYPNVKLITDVHEVHQVEKLVPYVDIIQIPAFLCRQTDLMVECAKNFSVVNIKKGQWLGPDNICKSVDKIKNTNPKCEAWICDRGSNFGYYDLFVNFGIVDELKRYYDRVILDCTHSVQRSRDVYGTQGDVVLAERYFMSADIFNYNGVFAEVHPNPHTSPSDGDCMIPLVNIQSLIEKAERIKKVCEI